MASIQKVKAGYRAFVYVKGCRSSRQFKTKADAKQWALTQEAELQAAPLVEADIYDPVNQPLPHSLPYIDDSLTLLAEAEIIGASRSIRKICGIYFLIHEEEVIYVGQSIDFYSRLAAHLRTFKFDSVTVIECPREKLDSLELLYIQKFSPRCNIMGKLRDVGGGI